MDVLSGWVILVAVVGAVVGVAADRLAARWPAHEDGVVVPRHPDWRTAAAGAGGAASLGGLAARWDDPAHVAVLGLYVIALIMLLATDLDQMLLPDLITLPLIGYALLVALLGLNPVLADKQLGLPSALAAAVLAPVLLAVTDRLFHGALGRGDLKLAVSLGLMAGLSNLFIGFLVATMAFAVVVLVLIVARLVRLRTAIPFGPALIAAGVIALLLP
ncbi:hypothetical protein BH23CHL8_BH23CHL8_27420 [soil metagenome]